MDQYNITDSDVQEVLNLHGLELDKISRLPKSGQRQVFEVELSSGESSILKFVDISPYATYQSLEQDEISGCALKDEMEYEIEARSKRVLRELEASKRCSILPQLELIEEFQTYKKQYYHFLYYFETKFNGNTLNKSVIYRNEQDIEAVLDFLIQMIYQIKTMYSAGYVHRDLTPRNILYYQGEYKIIDAGLVKSNNEEEKLTRTEMSIGTPRYAAPEQSKRTSDYIWDFRTDLFSIGLIAIEIFLPVTRYFNRKEIMDLHHVFQKWKSKDSNSKSIYLFSKVIARLSVSQRHRRWANLDELLYTLETLTDKEDLV